jgi:hypothetical protein
MSYTIKTPFNSSQNSEEKIYSIDSDISSLQSIDFAFDSDISSLAVSSTGTDIIDLDFKAAYSNYYHEITYTSGNVSSIDIWENSGKTTKLFTKALTYDGTTGNLTQIVVTDEVNSSTLTKAFTYDVDGNLQTITRTYA